MNGPLSHVAKQTTPDREKRHSSNDVTINDASIIKEEEEGEVNGNGNGNGTPVSAGAVVINVLSSPNCLSVDDDVAETTEMKELNRTNVSPASKPDQVS